MFFPVVSDLVKKEHSFKNFPLTVIPYYEGFNELQEIANRTTEFSSDFHLEPFIMDYIKNQENIKDRFDLKTIKYNQGNSTLHITKEFDDLMMTQEFKNELNEFFNVFVKDDVKIPKVFFKNVKETVEKDERLESNAAKIYSKIQKSISILMVLELLSLVERKKWRSKNNPLKQWWIRFQKITSLWRQNS